MKKNELFTLVSSIAMDTMRLTNAEDVVKYNKTLLAEKADKVVNHFIDKGKLDDLAEFLTDSFNAMDKEAMFGIRGVKMSATSTKDRVTYNMERCAKFFHRSFLSLDLGLVLKGYNPFVITDATEKTDKTPAEKITALCESLNMDKTAQNACLAALESSDRRAYDRQAEAREAMRKEKQAAAEFAALKARDNITTAFLDAGLSIEDLQKMIAEKQKAEKAA